MNAVFILLQTLDMTETDFRTIVLRVIIFGTLTMVISFWLLWLFWKRLEAESEAGEHQSRMSTFGYLIALVLVLILMSFVVYSLA